MLRSQCTECGAPCAHHAQVCRDCFIRRRAEKSSHLEPPNLSGLCECGCGQRTTIAPRTDYRYGTLKGFPVRFVVGHATRMTCPEYLIDAATGCWVWNRTIAENGYGRIYISGKSVVAHRYVFERERGPIPEGMVLDHLCRNRRCVNPDHLESVEQVLNVRRGKSPKLTIEQAREIRAIADGLTRQEVADRFGVSEATVIAIVKNYSWRE